MGEKEPKTENKSNKILIPVDFSNYSMKACEFAFNLAKTENAEVILLHVYFTPIYASSLPYGDVFNYQIGDEETVKTIIHRVHSDLNTLSAKIKEKIVENYNGDMFFIKSENVDLAITENHNMYYKKYDVRKDKDKTYLTPIKDINAVSYTHLTLPTIA